MHAVTLRAIARATGVTAPAIYAHFEDLDAILEAVVDSSFTELSATLQAARDGRHDTTAFIEGCATYVHYARNHRLRYQLLFQLASSRSSVATYDLLRAGVARHRPDAATSDINIATATLWTGLHGLASFPRDNAATELPGNMSDATILHSLITRTTGITLPAPSEA